MYVLIIEDDPSAVHMLQTQLANCGNGNVGGVTSTGTLAGAETELARRIYDLVFLDLGLSDSVNAIESLKSIKRQCGNAQVVVVSGYLDGKRVEECLEAGAAAALPKGSYSGETLKRLCVSLMERREAENKFQTLRAEIKDVKNDIARMKPVAY